MLPQHPGDIVGEKPAALSHPDHASNTVLVLGIDRSVLEADAIADGAKEVVLPEHEPRRFRQLGQQFRCVGGRVTIYLPSNRRSEEPTASANAPIIDLTATQ
jgi:hypothetical protein